MSPIQQQQQQEYRCKEKFVVFTLELLQNLFGKQKKQKQKQQKQQKQEKHWKDFLHSLQPFFGNIYVVYNVDDVDDVNDVIDVNDITKSSQQIYRQNKNIVKNTILDDDLHFIPSSIPSMKIPFAVKGIRKYPSKDCVFTFSHRPKPTTFFEQRKKNYFYIDPSLSTDQQQELITNLYKEYIHKNYKDKREFWVVMFSFLLLLSTILFYTIVRIRYWKELSSSLQTSLTILLVTVILGYFLLSEYIFILQILYFSLVVFLFFTQKEKEKENVWIQWTSRIYLFLFLFYYLSKLFRYLYFGNLYFP